MIERTPSWISKLIFFMMLSSSFVLIEPSPYDFLMLLVVGSSLIFGFMHFEREVFTPLIVLLLLLIFQLISVLFAKDIYISISYLVITIYLMISWLAMVGISQRLKTSFLSIILNGYLVSAVLSALIGISAYFGLLPESNILLMYGRAKAFFKDPNVFGPFLVLPSLFALILYEKEQTFRIKKVIFALLFIILLTGVFISFSRAAWGNWILSFSIYFVLTKQEILIKRITTIISLGLISIPIMMWLANSAFVEELFKSRLSFQGYDDSRFAIQKEAFITGLKNPMGIGPGQSELTFQIAPHSLYARLITENGIISLLLFLFFIFISIHQSYKSYKLSIDQSSLYFSVICASLIGLSFNSFFIDTLHWRHFWLLLVLAWCVPRQRGEYG
ncbi:MAG: hypothetical protein R3328_00590 [Planococcaceae bacterium]|nr:hypothetical protein [Planococcaceae bacterium]